MPKTNFYTSGNTPNFGATPTPDNLPWRSCTGLPFPELTLKIFDNIKNNVDDKMDIGVTAFSIAKEIFSNINIDQYSNQIDCIVDQVRYHINGSEEAAIRIQYLNYVFFELEKFSYDYSENARLAPDNYFLHRLLDTKKGICYTLPLLYLAVAQRLNFPIEMRVLPDHIYLRYNKPSGKHINIELTINGLHISDELYIQDFSVKPMAILKKSYMKPLNNGNLLGILISINAYYFANTQYINRAMMYYEKAIALDPTYADHYYNMSVMYWQLIHYQPTQILKMQYYEKFIELQLMATARGYTLTEDIPKKKKRLHE